MGLAGYFPWPRLPQTHTLDILLGLVTSVILGVISQASTCPLCSCPISFKSVGVNVANLPCRTYVEHRDQLLPGSVEGNSHLCLLASGTVIVPSIPNQSLQVAVLLFPLSR